MINVVFSVLVYVSTINIMYVIIIIISISISIICSNVCILPFMPITTNIVI